MEEAFEAVEKGLGISLALRITQFTYGLHFGDVIFDSGGIPNLVELADGCADLKVVTVGTEIACGINGKPIFEEVMRSNFTKFEGGGVREDGKVLKGPNYQPPNLEPILKAQGMK